MKTERRDSWSSGRIEPSTLPQSQSPRIKQSDSPPPVIKTRDSPAPPSTMSNKNTGSSSSSDNKDWDSLLKHSSALGILKPGIVFNSSYGSSSTASSSSRYTSSYTSGTSQGGSSSSIWSSSNVGLPLRRNVKHALLTHDAAVGLWVGHQWRSFLNSWRGTQRSTSLHFHFQPASAFGSM